jgi:exodeoxyribonuclease V alpha subunit
MARIQPKETLEGTLEKIFFQAKDSGFVVGKLRQKNSYSGDITVTGTLPQPSTGLFLTLKGEWTNHPRFGMQFTFCEAQVKLPTNTDGIRNYLTATFEGVGPAIADKIIKAFGNDALEVIDKNPELLLSIKGVPKKVAAKLSQAAVENKYSRESLVFLQSLGISSNLAKKIYDKYSGETEKKVRENPYILTEIKGIGFHTADDIAKGLGIPSDSPLRLKAGILYTLEGTINEGHVNYQMGALLRKAEDILHCNPTLLVDCLDVLVTEGRIVIEEDRAYVRWMALVENKVAERLKEMSYRTLNLGVTEDAINEIADQRGIKLSDTQKAAVLSSTTNHISVVTGGPGTGKTTILQITVRALTEKGMKVKLAAPTGRAAKRMAETTGFEASTIHRLLEFVPGQGPKKNEYDPVDAHFIVIDEVSMVDISLMYHLLSAMAPNTAILFVGDKDQLPSVGAGNVLGDMIGSGVIPVVHLNTVFRQAKESLICVNAHLINHGELPRVAASVADKDDFKIIEETQPEAIVNHITNYIQKDLGREYNPMTDMQCLVPMKNGVVGVHNLNQVLRALLNPKGQSVKGDRFRVGDKVMQIRNDYNKEVFNGDVGFISDYDRENDLLYVDFNNDRMPLAYAHGELDDLILAYACTIHKSQGSEYPVVIMPLSTQHFMLLRRNLLYTGVTRGKKLVILVGDPKAVKMAVENFKVEERQTFLAAKLSGDLPIQQISARPYDEIA